MKPGQTARAPSGWVMLALAALLGIEGLLATRYGYAPFEFQAAVVSLASSWVIGGGGLVAWWRAPASRVGPMLLIAAAVWFVPGMAAARGPWAASATASAAVVTAVLLTHAALASPTGRVQEPWLRLLLAGLYGVALLVPAADPGLPALAVAGAMVAQRFVRRDRSQHPIAELAGWIVFAGLAAEALPALLDVGAPVPAVRALPAAFAASAVLTATDAIRSSALPARLADLVLRLDPTLPRSIAEELRRLTGDPTLEVGFAIPGRPGFVDARGRPVAPPTPGSDRTLTAIDRAGHVEAVIIHRYQLDATAGLRAAVARAAALATTNARLLEGLRAKAGEVRASRLRLLEATQTERRSLRDRLEVTLDPRLDALERVLEGSAPAGPIDQTGDLRRAVSEVRLELERLVDGLFPQILEEQGLEGALRALAARSPVPVTLELDSLPPLAPSVSVTGWFVCTEALANVAKHAGATMVVLHATVHGDHLALTVADDGSGAVDPDHGTGLRGMRDRLEALGGSLRIDARPGVGTTLRAELPIGLR